jgi:hypothetical protein
MRTNWISAVLLLGTAAVPMMPSPVLAAAAIGMSFFWSVALTANLYVMPIDVFGPARAAFGVGALTCAYGLMQTLLSPWIGSMVDRVGFTPVCLIIAVLPLAGVLVLRLTVPARQPVSV